MPISAVHGDNVVERSGHMPWYEGPALLYHLEHVHIGSDRNLIDCRFPVQWVNRPGVDGQDPDYRGYAGQIAGGIFRPGDPVVVLPSGDRSRIASIDTFDGAVQEAFPPMSVTMRLEDALDISRGEMICRPHNRPKVDRRFEAIVCWMAEESLVVGGRYAIKHTTRSAKAAVEEVRYRIDVNSLHRDEGAEELRLNEIGRVAVCTSVPMAFDEYRRNRTTGSFILIDETTNGTVGAGMIIEAHVEGHESGGGDITWHRNRLTRRARWRLLGQSGATVWLTGLSASGKSTIAAALEERIAKDGQSAYLLDGDNLRHGLNSDLGFSPSERAENVRRVAHVARLLADAGTIAIVSLISPYAADRQEARRIHEEAGIEFLEVFVNTPLEECERRDPKGLYARAREGTILGFTGVGAPYEPPLAPDLELRAAEFRLEGLVEQLVAALKERGLLGMRPSSQSGD